MIRFSMVLALLVIALPSLAPAQVAAPPSGRCQFQITGRTFTSNKLPSGQVNTIWVGDVVARCPQQDIVLKSDSLQSYGDEGRIVFIGHVDYKEPRLTLKSDQLTYFQREERLLAIQNVTARMPSGSTLVGSQVEFFRAIPKVRGQSATAVNRPTINLVDKDPQGKPQAPVKITGNTVWMQGDSVVSSSGNVVVVRPELTATGDSLYADAGQGLLRVMRTPKIVGTKGRPFTLVGETIDLLTKNKKVDRVLAKNAAQATSDDLTLKSDTIDLRILNDLLQRAITWGKSRAHAQSQTQSIVADSIDVLMPNQKVREMRALRMASAEAAPDTVKFRTTEKDRITGDTIVAHFDTAVTKDTTKKPQMRDLLAIGLPSAPATSLQHMPPKDTSLCVPNINYVRGRIIHVIFAAGKIDSVTVVDEDVGGGVFIEPKPDSSAHGCKAFVAAAAKAARDSAAVSAMPAGDPRRTPAPAPPAGSLPALPPASPPALPPAARPAASRP
jgi:lipopolysaccharide export system protein LptA